jgi:hypothetical protein
MANLIGREDHEYTFWTDIFGTDSLGRPIKVEGKRHYEHLMACSGSVPLEEAQAIAYDANAKKGGDYKPSPELQQLLREVSATADADGNIQLGSRALERMEELGCGLPREVPDFLKNAEIAGGMHAE